MKKLKHLLTALIQTVRQTPRSLKKEESFQPIYRVAELEQDKEGDYVAIIQLISKNQIFKAKPEDILADDELTDLFSPRDVRTLTYLGYLGINSPKYKILAQRLSEKDNSLVFAVKEKGKKEPVLKKASEIANDEAFLSSLDQKDAHKVGYTAAHEHSANEEEQKQALIKGLSNNQSDSDQ